ncbi:MAG: hypothetical protein JKY31_02805 [Rhodobacteraceae bacterium]|nr:hypothetical protein [Paracoccaceae bacterium]
MTEGERTPDLARRAYRRKKIRDAALLLPLLGAFLLASPIIMVFANDGKIFGLPLPFVYIFGVWLGLVLAARYMARLLTED